MRKTNARNAAPRKEGESFLLFVFKQFGKWILAFFYSVWIFVLGILVGRETTPVKFDMKDIGKELAALKASVMREEERRSVTDQKFFHEKPPEFDFHEELKNSRSDIGLKVTIAEQPADSESAASESGNEAGDPASQQTPLKAKKEDSPKESEALSEQPESDKAGGADEPGNSITIQIASFKDLKDAERMVSELKEKGYGNTYVAVGQIAEKGRFYRVRAGFFKSRDEGRGMLNSLKKENLSPFFTSRD
jgi:cell division septation protein DedD